MELIEKDLIQKALKRSLEFYENKEYRDAEVMLRQIIRVNNECTNAYKLLALTKQTQGKFKEAIELHKIVLEKEDEDSQTHNNIGLCYSHLGDFQNSIKHLKKAIKINPNFSHYHNNLALQFRQTKKFDAAIKSFKKSIKLNPKDPNTLCMLGGTYGETKNLKEAERHLREALKIEDMSAAHIDLSYIHSLRGEWKKAWEEYEYRHECFEQIGKWRDLYGKEKKWIKGQSIEEKELMLYCEQGIGDAIHFSRYIPLIKCKKIILHCHPEIETLIKNLVDETCTVNPQQMTKENLPQHDVYASLLSLPYLLDVDVVPPQIDKSILNPINMSKYEGYKIGICWAGNPQHPNDFYRSCRLKMFEGISNIKGIQLFSLQKDTRLRMYRHSEKPVDLTEGCQGMNLVDMSEQMTDLKSTANIIASLDLVITVDTATLHLAGSMGKETWGLIPYNPDWRWKLEGNKTEWYPSLELFRQEELGNWEPVFKKIEERLNESILQNKQ